MSNGALIYPMCLSLDQVFEDSGKTSTNICINEMKVGRGEKK